MLLSVHAIWGSAPRHRQPNISGDDHERRVIARASRTANSSARLPPDQAQASAMPLSARLVNRTRA
jgi:hypothetical protein